MDIDTTDLCSYYAGYDDYIDTSKPIYSDDDFREFRREFEREIEKQEDRIDSLLDKLGWIRDKLDEIKNNNYEPTKEDLEYIEKIVEEDI